MMRALIVIIMLIQAVVQISYGQLSACVPPIAYKKSIFECESSCHD